MKVRHVVVFLACLIATYAVEEMNSQKRKARSKERLTKLTSNWSADEISGLH